jgi:hypothetical protein
MWLGLILFVFECIAISMIFGYVLTKLFDSKSNSNKNNEDETETKFL